MSEPQNLQSLGHAAGIFQKDPRIIANAIIVIEAEKYGAVGHLTEFDLVDAHGPDKKGRSFDSSQKAFIEEEEQGGQS